MQAFVIVLIAPRTFGYERLRPIVIDQIVIDFLESLQFRFLRAFFYIFLIYIHSTFKKNLVYQYQIQSGFFLIDIFQIEFLIKID